MAKKSSPYKYEGKTFRYDFQNHLVEYLYKASADEIREEQEWRDSHGGRHLIDIEDDGFVVVMAVGLREGNWRNKASRNEYLSEWIDDIDEEARILVAEATKEFCI